MNIKYCDTCDGSNCPVGGHPKMALPIKETPVLTGEDAIRFRERMQEVDTHSRTAKEIEDFKRAKKVYDDMRAKGHMVDFEL